ncbi:hypothetical protein [Sinomonas sp. P47F7]|uniref:hypothetical protein n=1 Tax=Sinomonas sp. P47F7 TaxID=3410987 RepID=UPI003BF607A4
MVEILGDRTITGADEDTLAGQVLGILHEALEDPGLCEEAKGRLRRLMDQHEGHPERALYEHLRCVRSLRAG